MLSQHAFETVTRMFREVSGIHLNASKKALVSGRLQKLAQQRGAASVDDYVAALHRGGDRDELVRVIDKLTTNETYFFREPQHFERLDGLVARRSPGRPGAFRVWSAASSSGEEAYSIAMVLADRLGRQGAWEVIGTDLSTSVVADAQRGLYPMERTEGIGAERLKRWCLRGTERYEGHLLIARELRQKVSFRCANLVQPLPEIGLFDVIFLRNVLIYFDSAKKAEIVRRVVERLAPDGLLFTGHAESLSQLDVPVVPHGPAVYGHAGRG